jgi:L-ascorbate metabolism protein UlaG (beta-lactamase superfamily)
MRITKRGHACVRVDTGGTVIVIDPGTLTEPDALTGAGAVFVTHEHPDHFAEERLRRAADADPALRIWTNRAVAARLDGLGKRVTAVGDGDTFTVGGVPVEVHGELHREVHPDLPRVANVGFLVAGALFHPGDAFTVPARPVQTLLLPVHGPWSRTGEVVDYLREIKPRRAVAIHDAGLSEAGTSIVDGIINAAGAGSAGEYLRLAAGAGLDLTVAGGRSARRDLGVHAAL